MSEIIIHEADENVARELGKAIWSVFKIECVVCCCREEANEETSDWAAAKEFALGGWAVIDNEVTCPDCQELFAQHHGTQGEKR